MIRVTDVTVGAARLSAAGIRKEMIERVKQNPADRAAARSLAGQVAAAAQRYLELDVRAQVIREAGHATINFWPSVVRSHTGRQIGGSSERHIRVRVRVPRPDARRLTADLYETQDRIAASRRAAAGAMKEAARPTGRGGPTGRSAGYPARGPSSGGPVGGFGGR
jgi:hypothetical protein